MQRILVTGGAGFVGSNLIKELKRTNLDLTIVSLDNYTTGTPKNHVSGVEYYRGHTWEADTIFEDREFDVVYHFGEYSRIVQSFKDIDYVHRSILSGTPVILELCRKWGAKLIYSASSSKFGNEGKDENLSPYSWMKAKMVELIKNYGEWYGLQYEICYFFNVYGPGQITEGDYATVVGIFERQYREGQKCTVVSPGTQTRDFTHIYDIVDGLIKVKDIYEREEWHFRSGKSHNIIEVAELFGNGWELIPERKGERMHSADIKTDTQKKLNWNPKYKLHDWITSRKNKYK